MDSRKVILAVGGVLLLLGLIYRFFPDLGNLVGPKQELAVKEKRLSKYRELVQEGGDLKARLTSLEAAVAKGEAGLLTGKTPSLAAADIQNLLHKAAEKCGVDIKTVRVLKPEASGPEMYVSIPVQFTISSTISQLKELIYLIESQPRYLKITKVRSRSSHTVRRRPTRIQPRGGKAQQDPAEQIRSDITVTGFFKKEGMDVGDEKKG
jgi:hypothetical protein